MEDASVTSAHALAPSGTLHVGVVRAPTAGVFFVQIGSADLHWSSSLVRLNRRKIIVSGERNTNG